MSSSSLQKPRSPLYHLAISGDEGVIAAGPDEQQRLRDSGSPATGEGGESKRISELLEDEHLLHHAGRRPPPSDVRRLGLEAVPDVPYPEPTAEQQLAAPSDFRPFFTLIEDPESGEHYHPSVHYVFSDDDPELLNSATLEALGTDQAAQATGTAVNERFVILDVGQDGKIVTNASSLSPDWQGVTAEVTQAPSWGDDGNGKERGLMLKIHGQEASKVVSQKEKAKQKTGDGRLNELVTGFSEKLALLDGVLGKDSAMHEEPAAHGQ